MRSGGSGLPPPVTIEAVGPSCVVVLAGTGFSCASDLTRFVSVRVTCLSDDLNSLTALETRGLMGVCSLGRENLS